MTNKSEKRYLNNCGENLPPRRFVEGPLEDRGNIFHGLLYRCIKRKLWSGRKDDPEVLIELNVETLKWYELKSCGNK